MLAETVMGDCLEGIATEHEQAFPPLSVCMQCELIAAEGSNTCLTSISSLRRVSACPLVKVAVYPRSSPTLNKPDAR
eukprot:4006237-Pyramimonas_sp.AAC.1